MSNAPIPMRYVGGKWYPVFQRKDNEYKIAIGENSCDCCDDCRVELQGGTEQEDGTFFFETDVFELILETPTPGDRILADGDQIKGTLTLKETYTSGSPQEYHLWFTRDFLHLSHGVKKGGSDLQGYEPEGHWYVWENDKNEIEFELEFSKCWNDYTEDYGEVQVGVNVGNVPQETILLEFDELPLAPGTDCCPYTTACLDCQWIFPHMGDPIGPEITDQGITYWVEGTNNWFMKVILSGDVNQTTKRIAREGFAVFRVSLRPPKDYYLSWFDADIELCFEHPGWVEAAGGQLHPRNAYDSLAPAEDCASSANPNLTCKEVLKKLTSTDALDYIISAKVPECYHDCGDNLKPQPPTITAVSTDYPSTTALTISITECPQDNPFDPDCCGCVPDFCLTFEAGADSFLNDAQMTTICQDDSWLPTGWALVLSGYLIDDGSTEFPAVIVHVQACDPLPFGSSQAEVEAAFLSWVATWAPTSTSGTICPDAGCLWPDFFAELDNILDVCAPGSFWTDDDQWNVVVNEQPEECCDESKL